MKFIAAQGRIKKKILVLGVDRDEKTLGIFYESDPVFYCSLFVENGIFEEIFRFSFVHFGFFCKCEICFRGLGKPST